MNGNALKYVKLGYRPWPVAVSVFEFDEDKEAVVEVEQAFVGRFGIFDEADLLRHRREVFGDEGDEAVKKVIAEMPVAEYAKLEAAFFARLMMGWSKLTDDSGQPLAYSPAALAERCTGPDGVAFRRGLTRAVNEIRYGIAPAKNFATSPSPGPTPGAGEAATNLPTT